MTLRVLAIHTSYIFLNNTRTAICKEMEKRKLHELASAEEISSSPPLNRILKVSMKQNKFTDSSALFKNFNSEQKNPVVVVFSF